MRINAQFDQRAIVSPTAESWVASPEAGVERVMLDRIGGEVARATSIVRYRAGSSFPRHTHEGGEEFLVLDGIFSDEHRDYPAGTYVRNPPGTSHSPRSERGCRILVKLRQFAAQDLTPVVVDAVNAADWQASDIPGKTVSELYRYGSERVSMLRLDANRPLSAGAGSGGLEWFLVSGSLQIDGNRYESESWFRFPAGDRFETIADDPCLIWQKSGHLPET